MSAILFCKKSQINQKKSQKVGYKKDHTYLNVVNCYKDSFMGSADIPGWCSHIQE